MLQPKVYIKSLDLVLPVEEINFDINVVEVSLDNSIGFAQFDFDEVEFMENTGLMDKNGKYIYVGDIVKMEIENETYFEVVKKEKNYNAFTLEDENSCVLFTIDDGQFLETVGNIYENKELLGNE